MSPIARIATALVLAATLGAVAWVLIPREEGPGETGIADIETETEPEETVADSEPSTEIDDSAPETVIIERTKYWDYDSPELWHALRDFPAGATETVGTPWTDLAT